MDTSFNHLINIIYKSIGAEKALQDTQNVQKAINLPWDSKQAATYESAVRKAFGVVEQSKKPLTEASTGMNDFVNAMRRALIVAPVWMVMRAGIQAVVAPVKELVKAFLELDAGLAKVMTVSRISAEIGRAHV
jgi:hypothetical protein